MYTLPTTDLGPMDIAPATSLLWMAVNNKVTSSGPADKLLPSRFVSLQCHSDLKKLTMNHHKLGVWRASPAHLTAGPVASGATACPSAQTAIVQHAQSQPAGWAAPHDRLQHALRRCPDSTSLRPCPPPPPSTSSSPSRGSPSKPRRCASWRPARRRRRCWLAARTPLTW